MARRAKSSGQTEASAKRRAEATTQAVAKRGASRAAAAKKTTARTTTRRAAATTAGTRASARPAATVTPKRSKAAAAPARADAAAKPAVEGTTLRRSRSKAAPRTVAPVPKDLLEKPGPRALDELVFRLITAAAERGLSAVYSPLARPAIDGIAAAIRPHVGAVDYEPPPSYRRFLAAFGPLRVLDGDGDVAGFCVLTPREVADITRRHVHVPARAQWTGADGKPCEIRTNHLVAFADAGGERWWCFDASAPATDGELPVRCHDPNEPVHARRAEGGAPVDASEPDFPDFTAWLARQVDVFCAPRRRRRR